MNIYEISDIHKELMDALENAYAQESEALQIKDKEVKAEAVLEAQEAIELAKEMLVISEDQFNDKATAYCMVIANMTAQSNGLDAEIKRLQRLKKIKDNQVKGIKERLDYSMKELKIDKKDLGNFKLGFRKSTSVEILVEDFDAIPKGFLKFSEPEIKKADVKKYLNEMIDKNIDVNWAKLDVKYNLQIR